MRQAGVAGVSRRKFITTTVRGDRRQAPDLVERNFIADAPDRLWVADITYIPTWSGFLYAHGTQPVPKGSRQGLAASQA